MIRIANGQGFWGDWPEAPVRLVEDGPIDFLTLDYLAEVTMSILQGQRSKESSLGYARDFPPLIGRLQDAIASRHIRVVANAGGVNPRACAEEVRRLAPRLRVAVVTGDDLFDRIDELLKSGHPMTNLDTGEPLSAVRGRLLSANAYVGAAPIAEALDRHADVVITGRCADASLALGPMMHAFQWRDDDWDRLAAGTVAGHIIECGAQVTGGNCQVDWQTIPDFEDIGYPIVEVDADGSCVVTKHAGTGGRVTVASVKEQLVYEIGDPSAYTTPDCVADFTTIRLAEAGPNRVQVSDVRGRARPTDLKVSASYSAGWKAVGTLVYSRPDALAKCQAADRIVRARVARQKLAFDALSTEFFGVNACHGPAAPETDDPAEVMLRMGVRGSDRGAVERFARELIALVLSGPPTATGYGDGRPAVKPVVAYWPALVPRDVVRTTVEVLA